MTCTFDKTTLLVPDQIQDNGFGDLDDGIFCAGTAGIEMIEWEKAIVTSEYPDDDFALMVNVVITCIGGEKSPMLANT